MSSPLAGPMRQHSQALCNKTKHRFDRIDNYSFRQYLTWSACRG
jgi:hypothetical protein